MAQSVSATAAIATSTALIDQFLASLESSNNLPSQQQPDSSIDPSPLHLLSVSTTTLKSSVTKLSLLAITTPFTASAVSSIVQPLNTSVLPSLVTATLLTSPSLYPSSFARECNSLTRICLRSLRELLVLVKARSEDGSPKKDITTANKQNITSTTGRVWEDCDSLLKFAKDDLTGFVCTKAGQWLELMKDAVKEFEEWDPEEEVGDDPFGLDDTQSDDEDQEARAAEPDTDRAAMSAGVKDQALKVLSRIPQSIHVVIKQRMEKMPKGNKTDAATPMIPVPLSRRKVLDKVLQNTRKISDCIDESAEAMYMGDPEMCLKKAGEARALTIDVVEAVLQPWEKSDKETKEDQYIKRALAWIQQVEPGVQQNLKAKGKA